MFHSVLIETLWNVKCGTWESAAWEFPVLIETLWNVKTDGLCGKTDEDNVLIETLWNVKYDVCAKNCPSASINRNIVECKDR